ncbi:hypothetical protein EDD16DRAFT_1584376, partial [Pisolithus croceorrhizus]
CGIQRGCWEVSSSMSGSREETRSIQSRNAFDSLVTPVARDCFLPGIVEGMNSTRSGNVYCKGLLLRWTPSRHRSVHQTSPVTLSPTQLWIAVRATAGGPPLHNLGTRANYWFDDTVFEVLKSPIVPHHLGYCTLIGAKPSSSGAGVTLLRQGTDILETRETLGIKASANRYCHTFCWIWQYLCHTYPIILTFVDATL